MSETRPELGDLHVGDELTVLVDPSSKKPRYTRARVVKVSTVWIDVEPMDGEYLPDRRFRRDNQAAKARPEHWTPRFYTDEQWVWMERQSRAHEYLREVGVSTEHGSRFYGDPLALANAIRRGLGEDEL